MKSLLVVIAGFISLSLSAQKDISINHSINDDGKKLSVKIKGTVDGKAIDYNKTFDVTGMNKGQKDALKERIYDSLGISSPVPPVEPLPPVAPKTAIEPVAPVEVNSPVPMVVSKTQYTELYTIGGDHPFTKEIRFNPKTGILYMKYRFLKNGEETTVEKSIEAKDKSKEERDLIIKKYEKEIGVLQPEII